MKLVLDFALITAFLFNILILFLLSKNSSKELHKRILQIIFVFIALYICSIYSYLHKVKLLFYVTFLFNDTIGSIIGPLLFLYIKSIFLPQKGLVKKNIVHFIIPLINLLIGSIPILISTYYKVYIFNYLEVYENYYSYILIYSLIYCFYSLSLLKKAREVIKHNYSNLDGIDLSWIKRFLIGVVLIICIDVLSALYEHCFQELEWNALYLTAIGVVFLIVYLGYNGILQSKILIPTFILDQKDSTSINSKIKKVEPGHNFTKNELTKLEKQLNKIMQDEKPFLDENLSLKSLSELLSISDKKLSAVLNQHLQISFYDYINGFKVENVINKMKDSSYDNYTLLAIAFESGFNSKTSFNRIFKKVTTFSPSQYKKQLE